jgi:hypothetical protein
MSAESSDQGLPRLTDAGAGSPPDWLRALAGVYQVTEVEILVQQENVDHFFSNATRFRVPTIKRRPKDCTGLIFPTKETPVSFANCIKERPEATRCQ